MFNMILKRIKRRFIDIVGFFIYHPVFLSLVSKIRLYKLHSTSERISKLGEISDLFKPEFIELYKKILAWQRVEKESVEIAKDSCSNENYVYVVEVYNNRISHNGRPGRSRKLRSEMIWETTWPLLNVDIKPGLVVADLGAENSCLSYYLASQGCIAYGLDVFAGGYGTYFRENILAKCNKGTLKINVFRNNKKAGSVIYKVEDATHINIEDNFFDRIFCLSTIEHIMNDKQAVQEMARILRPGGMLIITVPFGLQYSEDYYCNKHDTEKDKLYFNANRIYSREAVFERLIIPSRLALIKNEDFMLSSSNWKRHHFLGQSDNFVSIAIFLRKEIV